MDSETEEWLGTMQEMVDVVCDHFGIEHIDVFWDKTHLASPVTVLYEAIGSPPRPSPHRNVKSARKR